MTFEHTYVFTIINCYSCHAPYALAQDFYEKASIKGLEWWCPYCGVSTIASASEITKLKQELATQKRLRAIAEEEYRRAQRDAQYFKNSITAYKGRVTKLTKRIARGICPCCTRTFVNVEKHIRAKHPEFLHLSQNEELLD